MISCGHHDVELLVGNLHGVRMEAPMERIELQPAGEWPAVHESRREREHVAGVRVGEQVCGQYVLKASARLVVRMRNGAGEARRGVGEILEREPAIVAADYQR